MSFRESLYKDRDAEATGTAVFVGGKFTGFPEDWYGSDDVSSPLNRRNAFLLNNKWANFLRAGKEDIDLSETLEINGFSLSDINSILEDEGNGDLTIINTKPFNKEITKIGKEHGMNQGEVWSHMMDEGLKAVNPPSVADVCHDKSATYSIFESSGVLAPNWFNLNHYTGESGFEEMRSDVKRFRDTYNFSEGSEGDIPVVLKPYNGSGGHGIAMTTLNSFMNNAENRGGVSQLLEEEYNAGGSEGYSWLMQFAVPSEFDQRVISADGVIHTSSIRKGDDLIHNMDNGGEAASVERSQIQEGARNIVKEGEKALLEYVQPHENSATFLGWDVLGFDPYSEILDDFEEYRSYLLEYFVGEDNFLMDVDGTEIYGVPGEINDSPGYKIDGVNNDFPYQNSCTALLKVADDLSRGYEHDVVEEGQLHPKIRKEINQNDFTKPPNY